jgi:hypothetical protein
MLQFARRATSRRHTKLGLSSNQWLNQQKWKERSTASMARHGHPLQDKLTFRPTELPPQLRSCTLVTCFSGAPDTIRSCAACLRGQCPSSRLAVWLRTQSPRGGWHSLAPACRVAGRNPAPTLNLVAILQSLSVFRGAPAASRLDRGISAWARDVVLQVQPI